MRLLRTLLIMLLCAALPLDVLAASGVTGVCPMQDAASPGPANPAAPPAMPAMSDCAGMHDAPSAPPTGRHEACDHACKMSAQCQFGSVLRSAEAAEPAPPATLVRPLRFHYAAALAVRDPNGLWRPPRSV